MSHRLTLALLVSFVASLGAAPAFAEGNKGERLFENRCASCHKFDKHDVGPMLKGVIGRKAGSTNFGKYKALVGADFIWDEARIDAWIADPKKFTGKNTAMAGKIRKAEDRAAIIEYLKAAAR